MCFLHGCCSMPCHCSRQGLHHRWRLSMRACVRECIHVVFGLCCSIKIYKHACKQLVCGRHQIFKCRPHWRQWWCRKKCRPWDSACRFWTSAHVQFNWKMHACVNINRCLVYGNQQTTVVTWPHAEGRGFGVAAAGTKFPARALKQPNGHVKFVAVSVAAW